MSNPWKLATVGIALIGVTALATGVTTAWVMRPAAPAQAEAYAPATRVASVRPAVATVPAPTYAVAPHPASTHVARPAVTTVASPAVVPVDCATTGSRVLKIAKPTGIGGLLGAGLGAAGGAIANGGSGAGKGALIGGLAGAVLGGGYGVYKTKAECGTVLGGNQTIGNPVQAVTPGAVEALGSAADRIAVYRAR